IHSFPSLSSFLCKVSSLKKDNTFVYMCGLKGMEKGIDDIMVSLAARDGIDWTEYKRQLKKAEQWNVEVY
ncbi:hypothetical protein HN51_055983, partial [Arachis hypogaea]